MDLLKLEEKINFAKQELVRSHEIPCMGMERNRNQR